MEEFGMCESRRERARGMGVRAAGGEGGSRVLLLSRWRVRSDKSQRNRVMHAAGSVIGHAQAFQNHNKGETPNNLLICCLPKAGPRQRKPMRRIKEKGFSLSSALSPSPEQNLLLSPSSGFSFFHCFHYSILLFLPPTLSISSPLTRKAHYVRRFSTEPSTSH